MSDAEPIIRPSRDDDVAAITAIYAHHVLHGLASFEEVPPPEEEIARRRAAILEHGLPYLVAERQGRVVGYTMPARSGRAFRTGIRLRIRSMSTQARSDAASAARCCRRYSPAVPSLVIARWWR